MAISPPICTTTDIREILEPDFDFDYVEHEGDDVRFDWANDTLSFWIRESGGDLWMEGECSASVREKLEQLGFEPIEMNGLRRKS